MAVAVGPGQMGRGFAAPHTLLPHLHSNLEATPLGCPPCPSTHCAQPSWGTQVRAANSPGYAWVWREGLAELQLKWPERDLSSDDGVSSEASHTVGLCPAPGKDKPKAP